MTFIRNTLFVSFVIVVTIVLPTIILNSLTFVVKAVEWFLWL